MRISELFFLLAGLGMLISLPFFAQMGFYLWLTTKGAYFLGVIFFIREFVLRPQ